MITEFIASVRIDKSVTVSLGMFAALGLAGCATPNTVATTKSISTTVDDLSKADLGRLKTVKASPRVAGGKTALPRGGGYYKVGKPYTISGRRYRPRLDPNYDRRGKASWYGEAFHGRQTANGEVFDMNALTAAHKTMPLPSYARVTNIENGRSLIVRVNDRGPYAHNRVIDLSKRAAALLGFQRAGTANVRVQYIAKARLDGQDHAYLATSFRKTGASAARLETASTGKRAPKIGPTHTASIRPAPTENFPARLIQLGVFARPDAVSRLKQALAKYGKISHKEFAARNRILRSVKLRVHDHDISTDRVLAAAHQAGAVDARPVFR